MQLTDSYWRRVLRLRKLRSGQPFTARPVSPEEWELFRDLCMVWVDTHPVVEQYLQKQDPKLAPMAAEQVRVALENSVLMVCDNSSDLLELLSVIEATHVPTPPKSGPVVIRCLRRVLATVRPLIQTIRRVLPPWRLQAG